ncbi:MAG: DUF2953 domain-containing protein [Clostridiales bacterium]|nr:DUF2953 domain-containing protein [Clostridiales bacterium]
MLHMILLILKILGIILLIIIGLVLLLLYTVFFVAVSYRIHLKKEGTAGISLDMGWLFGILSLDYDLDEEAGWKQQLVIRLFGIPIMRPLEEKPEKKSPKKKSRQKRQGPKKQKKAVPASADETAQELRQTETMAEEAPESAIKENRIPEQPVWEHPSFGERIRAVFQKIVYAIRSIYDMIRHMQDTVRSFMERKDAFLEFWRLEAHRNARSAIWKEVLYLWKKLKPKRIEGQVTFGFDDPSATGMCMGALSVLYAWYPEKLSLIPDFDRKILEGNILIRGKLRLCVLACIMWRIWFNRDIRLMYENWKQR